MKESKVKRAFDAIEPEQGAQERMYANILKKAAAQKEDQAVPEKRRPIPAWQRWGSLAACLAVIIAAGLLLPRLLNAPGSNDPYDSDPPELGGSPIVDVSGAQEFERLGFTIDAPDGAGNVSYQILDGKIAQVLFSLDGREYTYRAAGLDGDFSGANGEPAGSAALDAEYGAVLDRLSPAIWRAHWSRGSISFYLVNADGADEKTVTAVVKTLLGAN